MQWLIQFSLFWGLPAQVFWCGQVMACQCTDHGFWVQLRACQFPICWPSPDSLNSLDRVCGCEMAFCLNTWGALRAPNGKMERSGRGEGLARFAGSPASLLPMPYPQMEGAKVRPLRLGPALAASCARHLLKSWLSGLSLLWGSSLPFHCVGAILTLRNEYWLQARFSSWIIGGQCEGLTACPAPATLAAAWMVSKESCLLEHLGITETVTGRCNDLLKDRKTGEKTITYVLHQLPARFAFFLSPFYSLFLPLFFSLSSPHPLLPCSSLPLPFLLCLLLVLIFKMRKGQRRLCFRGMLKGFRACFLHLNTTPQQRHLGCRMTTWRWWEGIECLQISQHTGTHALTQHAHALKAPTYTWELTRTQ